MPAPSNLSPCRLLNIGGVPDSEDGTRHGNAARPGTVHPWRRFTVVCLHGLNGGIIAGAAAMDGDEWG
ncbi:hypothetical protein Pint_00626 [Pistacia integerrima]|uniref:Uncharacterized protein n=1 Tax=Pistacia integerrima TaxID=434235 RepID=A0ACC0ZJN4_9ROSI|nr:hypothetical protein Pint_00626 [Pistacia integerrima]